MGRVLVAMRLIRYTLALAVDHTRLGRPSESLETRTLD